MRGTAAALAAARAHRVPVVHVPLVLTPGAPELEGWTPARLGLRAAIPKAGTWIQGGAGVECAEAVRPASGEPVVRGRAGAGAFAGSSDVDLILRRLGVTELYLAGFATHVCANPPCARPTTAATPPTSSTTPARHSAAPSRNTSAST